MIHVFYLLWEAGYVEKNRFCRVRYCRQAYGCKSNKVGHHLTVYDDDAELE